jgi:Cu(I)/Ag(I) efflux system membrane fusion protein
MNRFTVMAVLMAAGLGAAGGYWAASERPASDAAPREKKPLFYRHPMNPSVSSPVPAKDEMGMDYVPVYEHESAPPTGQAGNASEETSGKKPRKILYYRNPMGLPDTSPVPKKDSMGMDYLPVYADEAAEAELVKISPERIQKLGVRTAAAAERDIARSVRAVGILEADERRLYTVTLKFDGYIERLHVNATGQTVSRGQPLFELYSPELVSAQREYLAARKGLDALAGGKRWTQTGMEDLAQGSLERLRNLGISQAEIERLKQQGAARRTLAVRSPASGVVMEKTAMAGEALYKIADLSTVWVLADVFEQDIGSVKEGQAVRVALDAYPGRTFDGKATFIYPTLDPDTRTVKVRIELANPQGMLKPMMYARVEVTERSRRTLAIPESSVLDSGRRTYVLVDRGEGRFEPRPVRLGMRGDDFVEVLNGLSADENVVVGANFLIDAESNLKAALDGFRAPDRGEEPAAGTNTGAPPPPTPSAHPAGHGGR